MPKKSRKGRLKYKRQTKPQSLAVKEAEQPIRPLPALAKQASAAKSHVATDELVIRHQFVRSDLKRTFLTAAAIFALLVILYFILR